MYHPADAACARRVQGRQLQHSVPLKQPLIPAPLGSQIPRVPIVCTGNDFSTLYAPLIRDGRMEKYYWNPTREDRIGESSVRSSAVLTRRFKTCSHGRTWNFSACRHLHGRLAVQRRNARQGAECIAVKRCGCLRGVVIAAAGVCMGIFQHDGVSRNEVESIVDSFPGQSIDFFGAMRARVYDDEVRRPAQ